MTASARACPAWAQLGAGQRTMVGRAVWGRRGTPLPPGHTPGCGGS